MPAATSPSTNRPASGRVSARIPISLDRDSGAPLPVQLAASLREAIDAATLHPGEQVPATRELASRLGVSRGVVVAAYEQLIAEGYLAAVHGRGTQVNPALAHAQNADGASAADGSAGGPDGGVCSREQRGGAGLVAGVRGAGTGRDRVRFEFADDRSGSERPAHLAPGVPITDTVVGPAWRAAWREAAARVDAVAPPLGDPDLRVEIADHLRRMRATARDPRDVLVTAGTRDGLGLLLTALGGAGGREMVVGVEDPGLPSLRGVASRYGARIVALPADEHGLDTGRLPEGVLDVVIVTPSHQYPLGGSLPLPRRRELIAWARRTGVVIVEDDFDSELRYTGSPLPTLAALDDPVSGAVVLLGTFSRTVAPALSAGYLLAPAGLRSLLEPVRRELGGPVSGTVQAALAGYLASGELRRHTARMLRRYAARRDAVSDRLVGAPGVRVRPMDGGLHAVLEFTSGGPEREDAVLAATRAEGLGAEALGRYWQRKDVGTGMSGLVIGMGGSDDAEFDGALVRLRAILDAD